VNSNPTVVIDRQPVIFDATVFPAKLATNPGQFPFVDNEYANGTASVDETAVNSQCVSMDEKTGLRELCRHMNEPDAVVYAEFSPVVTHSYSSHTLSELIPAAFTFRRIGFRRLGFHRRIIPDSAAGAILAGHSRPASPPPPKPGV
jgi:hypothetical protein